MPHGLRVAIQGPGLEAALLAAALQPNPVLNPASQENLLVHWAQASLARGAQALLIRAPFSPATQVQLWHQLLGPHTPLPVLLRVNPTWHPETWPVVPPAARGGLHLPSGVAWPANLLRPKLLGRSTHNLTDVLQAAAEGCSYVLWGPVWPTETHPGQPGQGLKALEELCRKAPLPVLALGGVNSNQRHRQCLNAGAHGSAAIGAFAG